MLQITKNSSPQEISEYIKSIREQKGREKETIAAINKALGYGHDFLINLFLEEALTYQHMFMNNPSDKKAILGMKNAVLTAKFYIEKYKLKRWESRLFRFLGRISDCKGEFFKSVGFYKKAIRFCDLDPEPFRELELNGFLSYALIMSGKSDEGYKLAREIFDNFDSTTDGRKLKNEDFHTWAVWRSGIIIRTIDAFISKEMNFDKKEMLILLKQVENELKKGDFSYRKAEIRVLKSKLLGN